MRVKNPLKGWQLLCSRQERRRIIEQRHENSKRWETCVVSLSVSPSRKFSSICLLFSSDPSSLCLFTAGSCAALSFAAFSHFHPPPPPLPYLILPSLAYLPRLHFHPCLHTRPPAPLCGCRRPRFLCSSFYSSFSLPHKTKPNIINSNGWRSLCCH